MIYSRGQEICVDFQGHTLIGRVLESFDTQATIVINLDSNGWNPVSESDFTVTIPGIPFERLRPIPSHED